MRITYDEQADTLCMAVSLDPIVRDVPYGWRVNVGYSAHGIAEITILDARASGDWPLADGTGGSSGSAYRLS